MSGHEIVEPGPNMKLKFLEKTIEKEIPPDFRGEIVLRCVGGQILSVEIKTNEKIRIF